MPRRETPDAYALEVGQRIERLIRQEGPTLEKFAAKAGISKGHLSNVVHGLAVITIHTIRKIAMAADIHPGVLLSEKGTRGRLVQRIGQLSEARCKRTTLTTEPADPRVRTSKPRKPAVSRQQ